MRSNILLIIVVWFLYLKMWCFPWQSMQIALLGSAKSLIINTYTAKVFMNGLKFWNAVFVGLQIVWLKFVVVCFQWFVLNLLKNVHAVWFVEKSETTWSIKLFLVDSDLPRQLNKYSSKYKSHIYTIFCKASLFFFISRDRRDHSKNLKIKKTS